MAGTIYIKSLSIVDSLTTGMVNGKYVVGTKLKIRAEVHTNYETQEVRFVLTGAKESDNSWGTWGETTIEADSTAVAPGVITIRCIVTNVIGDQAEKTINVTIHSLEKNKYAYYFFKDEFKEAFKNEISKVSITLYNVYNLVSNQTDSAGKTIKVYGHNYRTFDDIKNTKHGNVSLTLLSTVKAPNTLSSSSIEFSLTDSEIAKLKKCKGLMFMIEDKNELTVHGAKCSITIEYK